MRKCVMVATFEFSFMSVITMHVAQSYVICNGINKHTHMCTHTHTTLSVSQ